MKDAKKQIIITIIIYALFGLALGAAIMADGEGISESEPVHRIDPELKPYLDSFVNIAKLKGIDLSYIYEGNIKIFYTNNDTKKRVATSYGRNKDNEIIITVYKPRFMARTEEGRKYVMFHEFGHDILNFKHLEHPDRGMMEPTAYTGFFKNYERFEQERQQKYLYTSLNKMFDRYMGDGIEDSEWIIQNITKIEVDGVIWVTAVWYKFDDDLNIIGVKTITHPEGKKVE